MLVLPIISILVVYLVTGMVLRTENKAHDDRTMPLLYSLLINTVIVLVVNEVLSIFHGINFLSLVITWGMVDIAALAVFFYQKRKRNVAWSEVRRMFLFPKINSPLKGSILVICVVVFYMALRTVPYNWDSMTYHLARIAHWVQNGSVAHYVCHDVSQISGPPLAEFVNLHVYILSGNTDYFVNLLQAASYFVSIVLVYKISRKIGCREEFSSIAMLVFASTPIVFAEALSSQVDLYAGLWVLIFAWFTLEFTDRERKLQFSVASVCKLLAMGCSASFAYLAKPSGCIALVLLSVWILIVCIRRKDKVLTVVKSIAVVVGTALIIILPEMIRNIITFHSISDEETSTGFLVASWDIRYLLANLVQNIGFNLTNVYLNIDSLIDKVVYKIAYMLYSGTEVPASLLNFELINPAEKNHDSAVNPLIFWLMILAIVFGIAVKVFRTVRKKKTPEESVQWGYVVASLGSFLVFGAVVRWYRFITRYEIGYIALLIPAVMLIFQYILRCRRQLYCIFAGMVICICAAELGDSIQYHKSFLQSGDNRVSQYFAVRGLYPQYTEVTESIKDEGYENIGFICSNDSYEYPLWKMLEDSVVRFEHVCVENETRKYDRSDFEPDCIIMADVEGNETVSYGEAEYVLNMDLGDIRLYEKLNEN